MNLNKMKTETETEFKLQYVILLAPGAKIGSVMVNDEEFTWCNSPQYKCNGTFDTDISHHHLHVCTCWNSAVW